ncbi:hypothetical protein DFH09DRAFT_1379330 [Mycena vulgaris]|nr:hypothetical protein DFH09DRAFT_1379330 [Mycena vulgaris]
MLLLLLLIRTLSTSGHPVPRNHLDSRVSTDSCDDINNCRKLFDIVWGCLATIFACTWVSVHPNVPPPNQSRLALFGRRLGLMLVAVIAPELMVGFAARQFFTARWYAKEYNISRTHGFFISMGGFVSRIGHHAVTTSAQLGPCDVSVAAPTKYLIDIRAVKVEEMEDKSKGDALSKGMALVQVLWFTTQCLARVGQRLPVTELEITTLAFAIVNFVIWILWWKKPLDVQQPISVGTHEGSNTLTSEPPARLNGDPYRWRRRGKRLLGALMGRYSSWVYTPASSVPSFWSTNFDDQQHISLIKCLVIECLVGIIFGAIHCAGWMTDFPSTAEMWMWRSCSALVAAIPSGCAIGLLLVEVNLLNVYSESALAIGKIYMFLAIPLYIIARLFLIALPFIALRAPPPGALIEVNWSDYIPHL